jgi:hypothetical protein
MRLYHYNKKYNMVSVDTVYQRVQAILNKENRGYMTPQEYNLLANQAQLEIFEQYFYDLSQFNRAGEITNEYANIISNIREKISLFRTTATLSYASNVFALPENLYRIGTIYYNSATEIEELDQNQFLYINASPLTKPDTTRPVFVRNGDNLSIYPTTITSNVDCSYVKIPSTAEWGYQEISGTALYDATISTNYDLHESEEPVLVYKILSYAGLVIKQPEISTVAESLDQKRITQEKS